MPGYPRCENSSEEDASEPGTPERRGRWRTFYCALKSGNDRVKVAQESIEIIKEPARIPESLMYMAGKFFKRFDRDECRFVSNINELYPDD